MNRKLRNEELNRVSVDEFKSKKKIPLVIVLDNIRSLNNIGSVFRTADAFLVEEIYLCGITAQPPHREIQKTALGATESVNWIYVDNTLDAIQKLKEKDFKIVSVEQTENSTMLNKLEVKPNEKMALIFGNEVNGVEQTVVDASDIVVEIPQHGTKHSLNISVSVGVVVWELQKKLNF